MRKLVVAMPINDEIDLLRTHLRVYAGIVDKFIIAEATWTHNDTPKPLHVRKAFPDHPLIDLVELPVDYDQSLSDGYSAAWMKGDARAVHVGLDVLVRGDLQQVKSTTPRATTTKGVDLVDNEFYVRRDLERDDGAKRCVLEGVQRNGLHHGILRHAVNDDDIIIICDIDEFICPKILRSLKKGTWKLSEDNTVLFPHGAAHNITHSTWCEDCPSGQPLRVVGPCEDIPVPLVEEHSKCYYGAKLNLDWHIFTAKRKKSLLWGYHQESAILTTGKGYRNARPHGNTVGPRLPSHFRRNIPTFPQFGPCGWHMSWLLPIKKVEAYAEWSNEEGQKSKEWIVYCVENDVDPCPIPDQCKRGEPWSAKDVAFTCFDRQDRALTSTKTAEYLKMPAPLRPL